jgi:hypothetical protein
MLNAGEFWLMQEEPLCVSCTLLTKGIFVHQTKSADDAFMVWGI